MYPAPGLVNNISLTESDPLIDDVIATGGTIGGAIKVLNKGGYDPTGALFLVEITKFNPILDIPYESVVKY